MNNLGSIEFHMLWASIALGIAQIVVTVLATLPSVGLPWAVGPRDLPPASVNTYGGRLDRALKNFTESFALFAAAVLLANALDAHTHLTALGAELYFWCRLLYVPAYAFGIAYVRTLLWSGAMVGIVLVLSAVFPALQG